MKGERVALPETEEELREFLDHAAPALCCVGADGRILWANAAGLDLVGCSEAEYVGQHVAAFLSAPEVASDLLGRLARGERVESYETLLRARDGSTRRVLIDGSALFRDGRLVHSRLVTRDIGGLIEREHAARQRAEATSHLKDEFLALLSHELRTPLGAILVWLGLLRQGGFDPGEREHALDIIERSARSLERIIEDLLHASRIAAGGLVLQPQLVDFRAVVEVAVEAAAGDAAVKGLSFAWAPAGLPIWVRGDPGRLQQAVSNLLSNAVKFTPAGGAVKVSLDLVEKQARLCVSDSGEGMEPTFLPLAFERFRQQDASSTRAHHGLGLGLYVVRHVIGHHGGLVSAESPGPGQGSTFTLLLPLAVDLDSTAIAASAHKLAPAVDRPPEGLTVLLVDDEEDVREALRLILQQNGLVVETAASAQQAFDLVERLQPDVLLSDIAMPGEDGLSLIRRVRLLPPSAGGLIPAAALSAYAAAGDRRNALLAGFQHHIAKPVEPAHLLAVIAGLFRMSAGLARARDGSL
jgi:PAS domain S-box-containing protein